jgi:hypothetical protein
MSTCVERTYCSAAVIVRRPLAPDLKLNRRPNPSLPPQREPPLTLLQDMPDNDRLRYSPLFAATDAKSPRSSSKICATVKSIGSGLMAPDPSDRQFRVHAQ